MYCVVKGSFEFNIISAWDRLFTYSGFRMPEGFSPVDFKSPDARQFPNFMIPKKFQVNLEEGDCIYVPAYWWYSVDSHGGEGVAVDFEYKVACDFLRNVFTGIEESHI